jgi:hypothetical protein
LHGPTVRDGAVGAVLASGRLGSANVRSHSTMLSTSDTATVDMGRAIGSMYWNDGLERLIRPRVPYGGTGGRVEKRCGEAEVHVGGVRKGRQREHVGGVVDGHTVGGLHGGGKGGVRTARSRGEEAKATQG